MGPSIAQYIGFIVLVVIMSALALELNRRIEKRRMDEQKSRDSAWVQLDIRHDHVDEPPSEPADLADTEDKAGNEPGGEDEDQSIHTRAKQNGHFTESKKPG